MDILNPWHHFLSYFMKHYLRVDAVRRWAPELHGMPVLDNNLIESQHKSLKSIDKQWHAPSGRLDVALHKVWPTPECSSRS